MPQLEPKPFTAQDTAKAAAWLDEMKSRPDVKATTAWANREVQAFMAHSKAEGAKKPAGFQKGFLSAPAKATPGAGLRCSPCACQQRMSPASSEERVPLAGTEKPSPRAKPKSKAKAKEGLIEDVSDEDSGNEGASHAQCSLWQSALLHAVRELSDSLLCWLAWGVMHGTCHRSRGRSGRPGRGRKGSAPW
jgi:hypothetical protein